MDEVSKLLSAVQRALFGEAATVIGAALEGLDAPMRASLNEAIRYEFPDPEEYEDE